MYINRTRCYKKKVYLLGNIFFRLFENYFKGFITTHNFI